MLVKSVVCMPVISPVNTYQYSPLSRINFYTNSSVNFGADKSVKTEYPDFKQYNIPDWGEYYCAPVSAANAVAMFSDDGYPNLNQSHNSDKLINDLAQSFKTTKRGTTTANLISGLKDFVESKGYKADIKYQGFRNIDPNIKSANIPDLNWITREINKNNAVLLNLGVYKKNMQGGKTFYTRQYGHFVTAVGCGNNGLVCTPDYLTIHDPYNRVKGDNYIKVNQINEGKLIHNAGDDEIALTDDAKGFLEVAQRFDYFGPDEVAVINGAISVEVHK